MNKIKSSHCVFFSFCDCCVYRLPLLWTCPRPNPQVFHADALMYLNIPSLLVGTLYCWTVKKLILIKGTGGCGEGGGGGGV